MSKRVREAKKETKQAPVPVKETHILRVSAKNDTQKQYLESIETNDMVFGVGPAGTGKTFLAVYQAVKQFNQKKCDRIILARPAVEAGEKLGFLPGTLQDKVDPYMRPIYDALYQFMGVERVGLLVGSNQIEIAPLAFMRGRTLDNAFVILDEAQNTTREQMKMLVTRLGRNSKAVITGDLTQVDLPRNMESGLEDALDTLYDVEGISITEFQREDVVRCPLVQRIVDAYEKMEEEKEK